MQQVAVDAEMVILRWAPVHLNRILDQFYFSDDRQEVETKRLWDDMTRYAYLPRLKDQGVLIATIEAGAEHEDFFGLAYSKDGDHYTGLVFGGSGGDGSADVKMPGGKTTTTSAKVTRFYGAATLDPISAKGQFSTIMDEVVQHFTAKYGTQVMT